MLIHFYGIVGIIQIVAHTVGVWGSGLTTPGIIVPPVKSTWFFNPPSWGDGVIMVSYSVIDLISLL